VIDPKKQEEIDALAAAIVRKMKAAGMEPPGESGAIQKTEKLLRNYNQLKAADTPESRRVVAEIDACMAEAENEPYIDVIRLFYFGGLKNAACAKVMCCDERNLRKARRALVQRFSARLAAGDFIREILT
jgi:hypothetical protein